MQDPGGGRRPVRLSAAGLGGLSWRPTRFVVDTLHPYVCSLCGLIPKTTVLLPCAHALCEHCKTGSIQDGAGGVCPLDEESFDEKECSRNSLAARRINRLKAYCWNQEQGCPFVDTLPSVLRHYEEECSFHAVECPRCGNSVPLSDLVTHYRAGCGDTATSSPRNLHLEDKQRQQNEGIVQVGDVKAALEEFKTLLSNPHQDQLLALQSQINILTEGTTKHNLSQTRTLGLISRTICELRLQNEAVISELKRHCEEECSSQAVECPRCGSSVRRSDLVTHYRAGCGGAAASKTEDKQPQQDEGGFQIHDITAALEELKTLLREPLQLHLPGLQSQMNDLTEEVTEHNQGQMRVLGQISRAICELRSQNETVISTLKQNFDEEESWDRRTPIPWRLEERHILRKLELFADESLAHLEDMRQAAVQHIDHPTIRLDRFSTFAVTERCGLGRHCWLTWREGWQECLNYEFIVKNVGQIFRRASHDRVLVGEVTQWHWRDVYFTVAIVKNGRQESLDVCFRFATTLESSRTDCKVKSVELRSCNGKDARYMVRADEAEPSRGAFEWDHVFWIRISELKNIEFVSGGGVKVIASVET
ncbi:uncharacterized protein LOC144104028 [Amblyomma americanum]